jgi:hypothetical protein
MTFTYSGNPGDSRLEAIRFLVGDTNPDAPHMSDEEIEYLITQWYPVWGENYTVAAEVADAIAGKYAGEVTVTGDGMSVDLAALQAKFTDLSSALRKRGTTLRGGGAPEAGGIDLLERLDPSIRAFQFGVGVHDNLRAGKQNYGGAEPPIYVSETETSS